MMRLRGRYAEVLAEHQRVLRASLDAYHGREVDTEGDDWPSTIDRLRACWAARRGRPKPPPIRDSLMPERGQEIDAQHNGRRRGRKHVLEVAAVVAVRGDDHRAAGACSRQPLATWRSRPRAVSSPRGAGPGTTRARPLARLLSHLIEANEAVALPR